MMMTVHAASLPTQTRERPSMRMTECLPTVLVSHTTNARANRCRLQLHRQAVKKRLLPSLGEARVPRYRYGDYERSLTTCGAKGPNDEATVAARYQHELSCVLIYNDFAAARYRHELCVSLYITNDSNISHIIFK
jgi:hypothetical protein